MCVNSFNVRHSDKHAVYRRLVTFWSTNGLLLGANRLSTNRGRRASTSVNASPPPQTWSREKPASYLATYISDMWCERGETFNWLNDESPRSECKSQGVAAAAMRRMRRMPRVLWLTWLTPTRPCFSSQRSRGQRAVIGLGYKHPLCSPACIVNSSLIESCSCVFVQLALRAKYLV